MHCCALAFAYLSTMEGKKCSRLHPDHCKRKTIHTGVSLENLNTETAISLIDVIDLDWHMWYALFAYLFLSCTPHSTPLSILGGWPVLKISVGSLVLWLWFVFKRLGSRGERVRSYSISSLPTWSPWPICVSWKSHASFLSQGGFFPMILCCY